jgi:hypothetical protein
MDIAGEVLAVCLVFGGGVDRLIDLWWVIDDVSKSLKCVEGMICSASSTTALKWRDVDACCLVWQQ